MEDNAINVKDRIRNVTCIGAGTIGVSWAVCFAMNGLNVVLYNIREQALTTAKAYVAQSAQILMDCGVIDQVAYDALLARITYTTDIKFALEKADYIQESTPENLAVKREIVAAIEMYAPATAICGSSTSRMKISDICAEAQHKERYIVAHPYNPPHLVPLVELAKGPNTSMETEQTTYDFFKLLKKEPIRLKKESPGFIGNRYQTAINREISDLVGRGVVTLEDANKALTYGPGFRYSIMGPAMVYDLASPQGRRGLAANLSGSGVNLLEDIAAWSVNPHEPDPTYDDQIDEIRSHLPDGAGESRQTAAAWRDKMLIGQLKLHKKI